MKVTLTTLKKMVSDSEKIAVLTCYDASFSTLLENAGVEVLLVGDSLGMVLQGHESTLPVSMENMVYHTQCVARGAKQVFIVADMPFGSYQESPAQALRNAALLMAAGAHMVKLEGGQVMQETVAFLTSRGIPVCGHLGLLPQSVNQLGGYKVQGKDEDQSIRLKSDAVALEQAGASMVVLEAIPAALAQQVTEILQIPTIGIGAGSACSGQVLVLHDLLGIFPGKTPKFAKNFMQGATSIQEAVEHYVKAVKRADFPSGDHSF